MTRKVVFFFLNMFVVVQGLMHKSLTQGKWKGKLGQLFKEIVRLELFLPWALNDSQVTLTGAQLWSGCCFAEGERSRWKSCAAGLRARVCVPGSAQCAVCSQESEQCGFWEAGEETAVSAYTLICVCLKLVIGIQCPILHEISWIF